VKCLVTFRLKPGVSHDQYEKWFREDNVPAVRKMSSVSSYRVWRAVDAFDAEVERLPEMAAMLEGWYARVANEAIVYAIEVHQD